MARLRVWKLDETRDGLSVILHVMQESDDGKHRLGGVDVTLAKTATPAQVRAAMLQARTDIAADPVGDIEHVARVIVDRINSGDIVAG